MKKYLLLFQFIFIVFSSCNQDTDCAINSQLENADNNTSTELSEGQAKEILQYYINQLSDKSLKSSSNNIQIGDSKKYYYTNNKKTKSGNSTNLSKDSIAIYNFEIENNSNKGYALLIGDVRFPFLLACSESGNLSDTIFNEGLKMWNRQIPEYLDKLQVHFFNSLDSVLSQVDKPKLKLGDTYPVVTVGDSIYVGTVEAAYGMNFKIFNAWMKPYENEAYIAPQITFEWNQTAPYNNNLAFFPAACNKPNQRYYAGCVPIAVARMLAHIEQPKSFNWTLLKQTTRITTSDDTNRINEMLSLMDYLHNNLFPTYECNGTGVSNSKIVSFLLNSRINWSDIWVISDHSCLPFLQVGYNDDNEGHAYIIEGYSSFKYVFSGHGYQYKSFNSSTWSEIFYYPIAIPFDAYNFSTAYYINWGWGGSSNGWYMNTHGDEYKNEITRYTKWTKY